MLRSESGSWDTYGYCDEDLEVVSMHACSMRIAGERSFATYSPGLSAECICDQHASKIGRWNLMPATRIESDNSGL